MLMTRLSYHTEAGISLYTMLAAVVVLGLLGSVLVTEFNGDNARATTAYALMNNIGGAAMRFQVDTGCYPTRPTALQDYSQSSFNSCGRSVNRQNWHGPYLKDRPANDDGELELDDFGPAASLAMTVSTSGRQLEANVVLNDATPQILDRLMDVCGGSESNCARNNSGASDSVSLTYAERS